jgi:hypothetical protein
MTRGKERKKANRAACGESARAALGDERLNLEAKEGQPAYILRRFTVEGVAMHERACKNCGGTFECLASSRRQFGDKACKADALKRRQARGLYIIDAVLEWRATRTPAALSELCRRAGFMLDQDKAAGRPSW